MTLFKQALANAKLIILLSLLFNLTCAAVTIYAVSGLIAVPKTMKVIIPPTIPDAGYTTVANKVPNQSVYSFTYYVWQSLQTWRKNGGEDYANNIKDFLPYLSLDFKNELSKEANTLDSEGMLLNHQQTTFEAESGGFSQDSVKYLGNDTWLVHLLLRTVNQISTNGEDKSFAESHVVRDAVTSYVFKVHRTSQVDRNNVWGLVISGYAVSPKTVKIYQ